MKMLTSDLNIMIMDCTEVKTDICRPCGSIRGRDPLYSLSGPGAGHAQLG